MTSIRNGKCALVLAAGTILFASAATKAAIVITEVDASGSAKGQNNYNQDWFELTNTGSSAVNISNYAMSDSHELTQTPTALRGVSSINPGQSVVFVEDSVAAASQATGDATIDTAFENYWFGSNVPAGFTIGNYGNTTASVGLSQTSDEVNIYDVTVPTSPVKVTGVGFSTSAAGVSFDNAVGLGTTATSDPAISTLSQVGVNGAFDSATVLSSQVAEIGSPGVVPEPASIGLLGVGAGMLTLRRRKVAAR